MYLKKHRIFCKYSGHETSDCTKPERPDININPASS